MILPFRDSDYTLTEAHAEEEHHEEDEHHHEDEHHDEEHEEGHAPTVFRMKLLSMVLLLIFQMTLQLKRLL